MVEPTLVIVEGFTVIGVDHHDGVVKNAPGLEGGEHRLDAGVHVGDGAVVLGNNIVLVGNARRHPGGEEVAERLEGHDRFHRAVGRIELVSVIEHPLVRLGRQVRRVRVHVTQEQKEGLAASDQPIDFGDGPPR